MQKFWSIIFWGALWGFTEATIGHFLHIWALPLGWLIWFPLAYGFMWAAYRKTRRLDTILYTALVASGIKLIDLFMPVRIDFVINPAVSILLEGLAVFAVSKILVAKKGSYFAGLSPIAAASLLWRVLYSIYVLFLPASLIKISPIKGFQSLAQFLFVESAANSLLIYGIAKLFQKRLSTIRFRFNPHPTLSFGMLLIACFVQWKF